MQSHSLRASPAPDCLLCGSRGVVLFRALQDRVFTAPGEWTLRACASCGFLWLDPRPDPAAMAELYRGYFTHDEGRTPAIAGVRAAVLTRAFGYPLEISPAAAWAGRLLASIPPLRELWGGTVMYLRAHPHGRLLDVGCGNGRFLATMRALGWDVAGIEPDPEAAALATRRLGPVVRTGALEEAAFPSRSFDAITLSHVLEHVPDPVATLTECGRILAPNGRIIVTTPNVSSLGRRLFGRDWLHWDPPRHLCLFTPPALRTVARRAGLEPLRLRTLARAARWSWAASRAIAEGVRPDDAALSTRTPGALLFQAAEHLTSVLAPAGEELLLVATV